MKVSFMQKVDYWVGVPLCLMLSLWNSAVSIFIPKKQQTPQKILFIELSEMGSAILAYSSLIKAKELFKNSELYFLIFEKNRESVEILKIIPAKNILSVNDRTFLGFVVSIILTLVKIRYLRIDTVIDLELFSRATALITYLSGAYNRVGFYYHTGEGLYRGNFLTHRVHYNSHQHMSLNFLSLIMSLKASPKEIPLLKQNIEKELLKPPQYKVEAKELEQMWKLLSSLNSYIRKDSRLIVLNPDPGLLLLRGWPMQNFGSLCRKLLESSPDLFFVVIGLDRSKPFVDAIQSQVSENNLIDLTGKTKTLHDLIILFQLSRLLITNDSGPAHIASLTNIKSIVLFGPETPALYAPLGSNTITLFANYACSPCFSAFNHRKSACNDNKCLQAISVAQVFDAAELCLRG